MAQSVEEKSWGWAVLLISHPFSLNAQTTNWVLSTFLCKNAGLPGAVVATMAVYTPSLVAMYSGQFYLKVRANHITQAIMHGVLPVVIAIILHVAISMGRPVMHSWWQTLIVVAVASFATSRRVNYGLLIAGSVILGVVMTV